MLSLPDDAAAVAGVIGWPVRHSLSPALHNAAFRASGLDVAYVAWEVPPGECEAALDQMRADDRIVGMSVTMPHKQAAAAACDELSPLAAALGAVNCVRRGPSSDHLVGENTDGTGFVNWLVTSWRVEPVGLTVAVVGAGGAASAVSAALTCAGAHVKVVNRTHSAAARLAAVANELATRSAEASDHSPGVCEAVVELADAVASSQVVVNATSLGMQPSDPLPVDAALLRPDHFVVDLIYHPARTPLLEVAEKKAKKIANGTGMLLFQAAEQFALWTGRPGAIDAMAAAVGLSQPPNPGEHSNAGNTFRTEVGPRSP